MMIHFCGLVGSNPKGSIYKLHKLYSKSYISYIVKGYIRVIVCKGLECSFVTPRA